MKKYIKALYSDNLCAQAASTSICSLSQKCEISSNITSFTAQSYASYTLKFLLIGCGLGYISGAFFSFLAQGFYFEFLSISGFISGAVFGVIWGTFIDLSSVKFKGNSVLIITLAQKETVYQIIKILKESRALKIYFSQSNE